jgi:hypothetical protein
VAAKHFHLILQKNAWTTTKGSLISQVIIVGHIFEIFLICNNTPPLLKKVIGEYMGFNQYYFKVELKIWTLSKSVSAWGKVDACIGVLDRIPLH